MISPKSRSGKIWFWIVTVAVWMMAFGAAQLFFKA